MLCPVCLADISVGDGVVEKHHDTTGMSWCPMSGKEPFVWGEKSTREAVRGRSGGLCEYCGHKASNMHHRVNRSQGGGWTPANVLHLCGSGTTKCHGFFTQHPQIAYQMGVSVSVKAHGQQAVEDPGLVPVRTPLQLLWLTDDIAPPVPR